MSIEDLCRGDTVFINEQTSAVGEEGNDSGSFSADSGNGIDCRIEAASASEINKFAARGMKVSHLAFFSSSRNLSGKHRLHWTRTHDNTVAVDKYLYVQGYYDENNPEADLRLFIAACDYIDTRPTA